MLFLLCCVLCSSVVWCCDVHQIYREKKFKIFYFAKKLYIYELVCVCVIRRMYRSGCFFLKWFMTYVRTTTVSFVLCSAVLFCVVLYCDVQISGGKNQNFFLFIFLFNLLKVTTCRSLSSSFKFNKTKKKSRRMELLT